LRPDAPIKAKSPSKPVPILNPDVQPLKFIRPITKQPVVQPSENLNMTELEKQFLRQNTVPTKIEEIKPNAKMEI